MDTTTIVTTSITENTPVVTTVGTTKTTTTIGISGDIGQIHEDIECTNQLLALLIILLVCGTACILFYKYLCNLFNF